MYELMVAGRVDSADSLFTKIEKMLKDANASSVTVEKMGKKALAFPIQKQTEAEYFLFNFEAPGETIINISDGLRLEQQDVLRYMIITTKVAKAPKVSKVSKVEIKESEVSEESKESKVEKKKAEVKVVAKSAKVEKEKVSKVAKVSKGKKK